MYWFPWAISLSYDATPPENYISHQFPSWPFSPPDNRHSPQDLQLPRLRSVSFCTSLKVIHEFLPIIVMCLVKQTLCVCVSCISHSLALKLNIPRWLFLEKAFLTLCSAMMCAHPQLWNPGIITRWAPNYVRIPIPLESGILCNHGVCNLTVRRIPCLVKNN